MGMLQIVLEDLGGMHDTVMEAIGAFDAVCNEHLQDQINPMLSIFTKLRQLNEDFKEAAKEVGEMCGDSGAGQWWEGGGEYDDGAAS